MTLTPDFEAFRRGYEAGQPQVVARRIVDDLETPVSAYLKIADGRPYAFLFESVEGGAWRGRYSIVAMKPDLVWRCREDGAEISQGEDLAAGVFRPEIARAAWLAISRGVMVLASSVIGRPWRRERGALPPAQASVSSGDSWPGAYRLLSCPPDRSYKYDTSLVAPGQPERRVCFPGQ